MLNIAPFLMAPIYRCLGLAMLRSLLAKAPFYTVAGVWQTGSAAGLQMDLSMDTDQISPALNGLASAWLNVPVWPISKPSLSTGFVECDPSSVFSNERVRRATEWL